MRSYPIDSPRASARIVALTMLADGYQSKPELDMLDALDAYTRLGFTRNELDEVVREACEDLLAYVSPQWCGRRRIDTATLERLLAEIEDPALKQRLLHACVAVSVADRRLAPEELAILLTAAERWNIVRAATGGWQDARQALSSDFPWRSSGARRLAEIWIVVQLAGERDRAAQDKLVGDAPIDTGISSKGADRDDPA